MAAKGLGWSDVKPRSIRTFVELGLLDHPRRGWPGHGGGSSPGWWPRAQFDLWRTLVQQRRLLVARVGHKAKLHATLCAVVVAAWLYFGEASGIPLAQVRRAMRTWASVNRTVGSLAEAQRLAKRFILLTAHPLADDRLQLREAVATMLYTGRYPEHDELLYRLQQLVDPRGRGEAKGPATAPLTAEHLTELILGRVAMLEKLCGRDEILPDGVWEWARCMLLWSRTEYQVLAPHLAHDPAQQRYPEVARLYQPETFETLVNAACENLLTVLSTSELARQATHLRPELRPDPWLAGRLRLHVDAKIQWSALVHADGARPGSLRVSVQVSWQDEAPQAAAATPAQPGHL
jgi:hypothetical protein